MKKKLSLFLMAILIVPIFALFGCDEAKYFPVTVFPSWAEAGAVQGNGTYKEGETVTLTASALRNSSVIGWVFQNSLQLSNDDTYKIANETDSANKVIKSTLSFVMSESTQGRYTAVMDENMLLYTKFSSWRITSDPSNEAEIEDGRAKIMTANLSLMQGNSSSELLTAFEVENVDVKENIANSVKNVNHVLELSYNNPRQILAILQINYKERLMAFNLRADLLFGKTTGKIQSSNYSYQVKYESGIYNIIFELKLDQTTTYYLVLQYKNLNVA